MTSTHHGVRPGHLKAINMLTGSGHEQGAGDGGRRGEDQEEGGFECPEADEWDPFLEDMDAVEGQEDGRLSEVAGPSAQDDIPVENPDDTEPEEEAISPPSLPLPVAPSQDVWDEHFRTGHILFRSWCPICIKTRGREAPHRGGHDHQRV